MKEHPKHDPGPTWTREHLAEAFRILGVHSTKRIQLADAFTQLSGPWTLPQLALITGIPRTKIYATTDILRDLDILQPTRPQRPGANIPTQYVFNGRQLREALEQKASEASQQILSVIPEAHP